LKEARQAAEEEIAKYRKEKEAEFEKMRAEVRMIAFRKRTRSSRRTWSEKRRRKSRRSRKTTRRTRSG
jgi:hypothetical protein